MADDEMQDWMRPGGMEGVAAPSHGPTRCDDPGTGPHEEECANGSPREASEAGANDGDGAAARDGAAPLPEEGLGAQPFALAERAPDAFDSPWLGANPGDAPSRETSEPAEFEAPPEPAQAPSAAQLDEAGALGTPDPTTEAAARLGTEHEAPSFLSEVPEGFPLEEPSREAPRLKAPTVALEAPRRNASDQVRTPDTVMLVNDVTGDECRIALVRKGRLEAFFGERVATATSVGNIYKGRVTNVEPAIQAAFVDFGESQNGFLHVSDLHPRYFPGADRTEKVGHKIPRRDRPPIQEALRRGQEILVQVIKEGLGTKGPTLTSYLSIPGRLLVMMPDMDNVGVSRKVEDEGQRRAMRQILDSLDLPEGFGFILRTAGFDRSRTELQRDASYLMRLWQAMEKRMQRAGAPCELYTESDLLVRTIRDVVDDSVHTIVVDSVSAYDRASLFLEVAFPKDPPQIRFYNGPAPIFHAFGIEPQVRSIYAREVPLPSGGALVFDQTEAMVAIDVNSGKSRSARDSETNAYNTNKEAVDEICRQLRLRDLGGLVVCDLIDMRQARHRREIEERFREQLRRDRAKTTVLPVSDFGIVEITRQRMRPSVQKMHFMACPHCEGLGQVKIPDSTASDALRDVQSLLGNPRIHRVEMVCSVKVASVLLSGKRDRIYEIERRSGKRVDVRISEALPVDRVDLYGYDERGADVEIDRLTAPTAPALESLPLEPPIEEEPSGPGTGGSGVAVGEERGRRRRRRRPAPADAASIALAGGFDDLPDVRGDEPSALEEIRAREAMKAAQAKDEARAAPSDGDEGAAKDRSQEIGDRPATEGAPSEGGGRRGKRRRGRRGGRNRRGAVAAPAAAAGTERAEAPAQGEPPVAHDPSIRSAAPPRGPAEAPPAEPRRVHLLAKDLGVSSKELLALLRERQTEAMPLDAKSHMSLLSPEWVAMALSILAPDRVPSPAPTPEGGQGAPVPMVQEAGPSPSSVPGGDGAHGEGGGRRRKRRRRGRRGKGGGDAPGSPAQGAAAPLGGQAAMEAQNRSGGADPQAAGHRAQDGSQGEGGGEGGKKRRRRRRRGRGGEAGLPGGGAPGGGARAESAPAPSSAPPSGTASSGSSGPADTRPSSTSGAGLSSAPGSPPSPPKPRGLYGRAVRKLAGPVKYDDR